MKRVLVLVMFCFFITGCTQIKDLNYEQILNDRLNFKIIKRNVKRKGYEYNIPSGLKLTDQDQYNDVIESEYYKIYLYVDLVSYHNKTVFNYSKDDSLYYSYSFSNDGKNGYLEINKLANEKYLIEIMYNYAKIEVMVDEYDINEALYDSVSILSSILYNDKIIENLMKEDILNFSEEEFNIFETNSSENNVLELFESESDEVDDAGKADLENIPDTDLVN